MTDTSIGYHQPKGLYILFSTELWERFGFYTIQTIIILYLTKGLLFSDHDANLLYAASSALLYLTPTIGGYIADKYIGFQKAIITGGFLFMLGYGLMAVPNTHLFYLGLCIIACANGLFKPNVSGIVGTLYEKNDPRRDSGFTLFYMGINIGGLIPPLFAGPLVDHFGWHSGFFVAAGGMLFCLAIFMIGRARFAGHGLPPATSPILKGWKPRLKFNIYFYIGLVIAIALCYLALLFPATSGNFIEIATIVFLAAIIFLIRNESKAQKRKMLACIILIIISVVFWSLYNQIFTSLTLFADRNMIHHLWGIPVDAESMQFFNPFFIVLLTPIFSPLWIYLGKHNYYITFPTKFALGVLFMSLGFLVLALSTKFFAHNGLVSPWWLVFSYFVQTIGELLLSPIGLSMVTVLSPTYLVGMMMGIWFFSIAASFVVAGYLANLAAIPDQTTRLDSLAIYHHAFFLFGSISFIVAIACFLLVPFLKRMIGEVIS